MTLISETGGSSAQEHLIHRIGIKNRNINSGELVVYVCHHEICDVF